MDGLERMRELMLDSGITDAEFARLRGFTPRRSRIAIACQIAFVLWNDA